MTDEPQQGSDVILHQGAVEEIIDDKIVTKLQDHDNPTGTGVVAITPITGGQSPTEAEHNALVDVVNEIRQTLFLIGVYAD